MNPLEQFFQYTVELVQLLENKSTQRDDRVTRIENLLGLRQTLLPEIKGPFSKEEREIYLKLQQLDKRLQQLLVLEKAAIQKDIKSLHQKKETSTKYTNPYDNLNTDGMFYDKRN